MSRGELIVEDNQVKPGVTNDWANEFQQQHLPPGDQWASEFMGEVCGVHERLRNVLT